MRLNHSGSNSLPRSLEGKEPENVSTQYGALCYRVSSGRTQILLITSRNTRRWIVPKGWPMNYRAPAQAAMTEAWEEAGVIGTVQDTCIGMFGYLKRLEKPLPDRPCAVMVYPVRVRSLARDFPERGQRKRKWFSPKQAAKKVAEPELRRLLRDFDPRKPA